MKYSVVIAAKNEADKIADAIKSARGANEVIVIDDLSTDQTAKIAKSLGAKVIQRQLDGFASQKNFGIDQASQNWVLILDADERLSPELAEEIAKLEPKYDCYQIAFRNYLGKKWLRHGGLYPDYHQRLFDRRKTRYGSREIHEQLDFAGPAGTLKHDMIHLTYSDLSAYKHKVKKYAELEAKSDHDRPSWSFIFKTFYRKYLKDAGWLDGFYGLASAMLLAYYQYLKRKELSK